jgi:hypothetical protein
MRLRLILRARTPAGMFTLERFSGPNESAL